MDILTRVMQRAKASGERERISWLELVTLRYAGAREAREEVPKGSHWYRYVLRFQGCTFIYVGKDVAAEAAAELASEVEVCPQCREDARKRSTYTSTPSPSACTHVTRSGPALVRAPGHNFLKHSN